MAAAVEVSQGVPTFVKDLFSGACGGIAQVLIGEFGVFFFIWKVKNVRKRGVSCF
jgi:hypothetical protein